MRFLLRQNDNKILMIKNKSFILNAKFNNRKVIILSKQRIGTKSLMKLVL